VRPGFAAADLDWFKKGAEVGYLDTAQDAGGKVTEATQQGKEAATLDVTWTDLSDRTTDAKPRLRELELVVVSGKGDEYTLVVTMPAADAQAAQGGRVFDDVRSHLRIADL
jgi:hypothetical protein